ncbi:myosin-G heavy chain [Microplitis demolitor]|uniref:myosin-G heavy chain n=1 Tax=Microplitis demolitor TaxID=69319 RepID=UPI0004CD421D|nr:myosin-G heavy chain [Microplitis demolitor]XP_008559941.1 myosin-G heavy chain [Microplitis demolitor]XP_008559942.1 myosin-G heavy chain [Microplitis demolitor]XP_053594225.1 myosin-G heavy chain [Microplitis demolitor]
MPLSIKVNLRVTGHCNQGGRKYMEDMFSVAYQQTSDDKDLEYAFFGIFDGHGGGEAAKFAKDHLMDIIVKQKNFWSDKDEDVLRAIRDGYVNTHYAMWRELDKWPRTASGLPSTAGTTASIAFIRKGKIYVGHVGDSGIILGYQDEDDPQWKAKPLTRDHKPESGPEMIRIQESGGKVISKSGVPRVVWNRPRIGHKGPVRRSTHIDEIPFLAVARSLGDLWSYNSELDTFVVSPEPDVKVIKVDVKSYRCLIFGTDGLWNMLTPQAAVAIVQAAERHNEKHFIASQQTGNLLQGESQMWINPSKSLVDRALERWSSTRLRADNTSVVTLMIDPPGPSRCEVLMNRRQKDAVASVPKTIPTPLTPHSCNSNPDFNIDRTQPPTANVVVPPSPVAAASNLINNTVSEDSNQTISPSSSSSGLNESLPGDYSFQENCVNYEPFVGNNKHEKVENINDTLSESSVKESTSMENIQVAEISSSDISNDDAGQLLSDDTVDDKSSAEENTKTTLKNDTNMNESVNQSSVNDSLIETTVAEEEPLDNDFTKDTGDAHQLTRENAFFGSWESFNNSRSGLNNSANSSSTDLISSQTSVVEKNNPAEVDCEKDKFESLSADSNLDKPSDFSSEGIKDETKNLERRENDSVQTSPQLMPATSTSVTDDKKMPAPSPVDTARLKRRRETPLRPGSTRRTTGIVNNKRRHSSTLEDAEDSGICAVPEPPNFKRRTRSEDRRCDANAPTDENNPINQEQSKQQSLRHDRVRRWPGNSRCSVVSKLRNVNSPTTSYSAATNTSTPNTREKLTVSPTSFQRRSLEKKATPVKTIRRPSINGSSRVQLRGSFALRDWDQSKSSHHHRRRRGARAGSCSSDRSRLNHVITGGTALSSDPTSSSTSTPQRWLRSDTIAAIPIKTLRSRNVDIASGHTVPPQLAHQYNIIKQNRLSLPPSNTTKLRMSSTPSKVKSTTTITAGLTTSGKLKQAGGNIGGANGSSASVSPNSVPGIAKRVKSTPYNPSARSLGTRSRLKRLSK